MIVKGPYKSWTRLYSREERLGVILCLNGLLNFGLKQSQNDMGKRDGNTWKGEKSVDVDGTDCCED